MSAFLVSLLGTRLAMWLAPRVHFLDHPGSEAHKLQTTAVAYGGGIAMAVAMLVGMLLVPRHGDTAVFSDASLDHATILPILSGAVALLVMGAIDDIHPLSAWIKLGIQAVVAAMVVPKAHLGVDFLQRWPMAADVAAWLWLMLITNAYNLLDHADGLAGSVAVVSLTVLLGGSLMDNDLTQASLWLLTIGAVLGFLVWNLPPARIYMGDAGSLPLGFLIAAGTLSVTFWPSGTEASSPLAVLSPLIVTAIPVFDALVVVVKRAWRRKPILQGDRNHISHRLSRLGHSQRSALAVVVCLQVALSASAFVLRLGDTVAGIVVLAQDAAILIAVMLLETVRDSHVE